MAARTSSEGALRSSGEHAAGRLRKLSLTASFVVVVFGFGMELSQHVGASSPVARLAGLASSALFVASLWRHPRWWWLSAPFLACFLGLFYLTGDLPRLAETVSCSTRDLLYHSTAKRAWRPAAGLCRALRRHRIDAELGDLVFGGFAHTASDQSSEEVTFTISWAGCERDYYCARSVDWKVAAEHWTLTDLDFTPQDAVYVGDSTAGLGRQGTCLAPDGGTLKVHVTGRFRGERGQSLLEHITITEIHPHEAHRCHRLTGKEAS